MTSLQIRDRECSVLTTGITSRLMTYSRCGCVFNLGVTWVWHKTLVQIVPLLTWDAGQVLVGHKYCYRNEPLNQYCKYCTLSSPLVYLLLQAAAVKQYVSLSSIMTDSDPSFKAALLWKPYVHCQAVLRETRHMLTIQQTSWEHIRRLQISTDWKDPGSHIKQLTFKDYVRLCFDVSC